MLNDTLATVYYSSTCGGLSEAVQNVWPGPAYKHLQPGKDLLGDNFACSVSPHFRWKRSFTIQQLDSLFKINFNRSFLDQIVTDSTAIVFGANILERSSTGRVQKMSLSLGDTTVVLSNFEIRKFFSTEQAKTLKSRFFSISDTDSTLVIKGGGYGHGVGLCQWGALNMSQQGFKYYDILVNKYFKGTYLKKVY